MAAAAAPACAEVASSGRVKGSRSTRGERWRRPWRGERVMQRPRRVETGAETWSGSETPRRRRHAPQAVGKKGRNEALDGSVGLRVVNVVRC